MYRLFRMYYLRYLSLPSTLYGCYWRLEVQTPTLPAAASASSFAALPDRWVEGEERFSVKADAINTTCQRISCSLGRVERQAKGGARARTA